MAGEVSRDITNRILLPQDIVTAHEAGIIHFHDSDYYAQHMHNCDLINLEDMLQNGTVISGTKIERPHSFSTACNIATQIIAQVASNQYGGQSISLTHLVPFVQVSREKIRKSVEQEAAVFGANADEAAIEQVIETRLRDEVSRGVQTIQYQVVTLMTTNGQAPFITVFMYLNEARNEQEKKDLAMIIEEMLRQRYQGVKNEKGVWVTPAFPKLIYVLEPDNITADTPYWYLTKLAAQCTAKRMVPDYISEKKMLELKIDKNGEGHCYTCMGCRSFLTPYVDEEGKPKYYGRFNQGVVTINLVDVALSSGRDMDAFWKIFDERLELCHKALMCRHERLKGTLSDAAPILWQHGALARLPKGEPIDKLLFGGYSTISLGYAGLYECVKYMTGKSHTDEEAKPFALAVMQHMNDACKTWKAAHNMDFSLYGTPLESTTYKFANRIIKFTCKALANETDSPDNKKLIRNILIRLNEVSDVRCVPADCDGIRLSRLHRQYHVILSMSKMFLLNQTTSYSLSSQDSFCFLFPTELLFEGFIGGFIKETLEGNARVRLQASELTLISDVVYDGQSLGKAFTMRHDILVEHKELGVFVLDTKYKHLSRFEGNDDVKKSVTDEVSQNDLYQVIEYAAHRDLSEAYLLYPMYRYEQEEPTNVVLERQSVSGKAIRVHIVRLPFIFEDEVETTKQHLAASIKRIFAYSSALSKQGT